MEENEKKSAKQGVINKDLEANAGSPSVVDPTKVAKTLRKDLGKKNIMLPGKSINKKKK
jgi:hypothetical protein